MSRGRYVEVSCYLCDFTYTKRIDTISAWGGTCRSCAAKESFANRTIEEQERISVKTSATWQANRKARPECIDCGADLTSRYSKRCRPCSYIARKGIPLCEKALINAKINHLRGENHPNWKGGITPDRNALMATEEYKIWRYSIFKRDNWTCVECGARSAKGKAVVLHADHIKPWSKYPELETDIDNGRTLCEFCHRKTDTYGVKMLYQ